jgi:hypothetical protein
MERNPIILLFRKEDVRMRAMFKFLMMMVILATLIGIAYYIWRMMAVGIPGEPVDVIE